MAKIKALLSFILLAQVVYSQHISLSDITAGKFVPRQASAIISDKTGEYFFAANDQKNMIIKYAYKTGNPIDTIFHAQKARECHFSSFEGFVISPDEKRLLLYLNREQIYRRSFKADYYHYDIRRNLVNKLTDKKSKQSTPVFSRDGRMLAYVCQNNIWLVKFDYGSESQITSDGQASHIINGAVDWVYEEEFATTHIIDFSADNKLLAFVRFDETEVPRYSFPWYRQQQYPTWESFKYPKVGQKNSKVTCRVFDIDNKTMRTVQLPKNYEYIPRIQFLPDASELAVMTLNREQNDFSMYLVNPRSMVPKLVLQEKSKYYIDPEWIHQIQFLSGQFIYVSPRNGFNHIYLYDNAGNLRKQLTKGNYDITSILAADAQSGMIYFQAAGESPLQREVYKLNILKGSPQKITPQNGYNEARFSEKGKYFVHTWSDLSTPPQVSICDNQGKTMFLLEDNKPLSQRLSHLSLPQKKFITLHAADGTPLNGYLLYPTTFDSSKTYPLVMVQYSGPNSQQVLDKYTIDWTYYLVEQGYIVACVDGRGTGARGELFKKQTYLRLGVLESDDQIAAATQLGSLPYIDAERIALWGWSFGGYNVLLSMGRGQGIFKAGVSIAPVSKWEYYDTAYTERYMQTPQQNQQGYHESDATNYVDTFSGNLLLIHGTADDNVHLQHTMDYATAMIKANKQFDMFIFPDKNHSITGGDTRHFLYRKIINFLNNNL